MAIAAAARRNAGAEISVALRSVYEHGASQASQARKCAFIGRHVP